VATALPGAPSRGDGLCAAALPALEGLDVRAASALAKGSVAGRACWPFWIASGAGLLLAPNFSGTLVEPQRGAEEPGPDWAKLEAGGTGSEPAQLGPARGLSGADPTPAVPPRFQAGTAAAPAWPAEAADWAAPVAELPGPVKAKFGPAGPLEPAAEVFGAAEAPGAVCVAAPDVESSILGGPLSHSGTPGGNAPPGPLLSVT